MALSTEILELNAFLQSLNDDIGDFGLEVAAPIEGNNESLDVESSTLSPADQTRRPKKRNYDPNKARSRQLRELQRLRVEATDLELKLQQLQNGIKHTLPHDSKERNITIPAVWEDICTRQFDRRLRAERENYSLKKKYKKEMKVTRNIEKLLFKRWVLQESTSEAGKCVRRVEIPTKFIKHLADRIFQDLAAGVEVLYHEVEAVLDTNCPFPLNIETREPLLHEDASMELFDRRVLPFGLHATGDAWWRRWQKYRGQPGDEDVGDTIRERCGLEMADSKTDMSAKFYVQQVLRRHVEDHREVIVWNGCFEPFTFDEERVHGVQFLVKGCVLMKPAERDSSASGNDIGDAFTRVLTCYKITPYFSDPTIRQRPKISALIKFVVSTMSGYLATSNEATENLLVDEALQKLC